MCESLRIFVERGQSAFGNLNSYANHGFSLAHPNDFRPS